MSLPGPIVIEAADADVLARIVGQNRDVLDCGCGSGKIAALLRVQQCTVVGIEQDEARARRAESACDRVVVGSLTSGDTWQRLEAQRFDVVLFSHVLEHIPEALNVLRKAQEHLVPGGVMVAAVPNVGNWRIRLQLLLGRWDYQDFGIMDRTHVRFYTFETAGALFAAAGLEIVQAHVPLLPPGGSRIRRRLVAAIRPWLPPTLFGESFIFELAIPAHT